MIYRFKPLLFNHYLQTVSTKLFLLDTSRTVFVIKDFAGPMLMYLSAGIIFAFGKLHPVVGKLQLGFWGISISTMKYFSSVKTEKGNSSFPGVLEWLCRELLD